MRGVLRSRRLMGPAIALGAALVLAGCTVPAPPGAGQIRYRDPVFPNITKIADLTYGSAPDLNNNPVTLTLDLYEPTGDTVSARPAIVFVHGGGYCCGDKSSGPSADLAQRMAHDGYVTVSINYRLLVPSGCSAGGGVSSACYTAALAAQTDAQAAVRWLRANAATYGIDTSRIGIGGDSAGAITATLVAVDAQNPGSSGNPGYPSNVNAFMSLSGGLPNGLFVDSDDAPGLLFSGTADPIVPYSWSAQTTAALLNSGVAAFLESWPGAGHDPYTQFQAQIDTQTDYFFYDFLDAAHAQGSSPAAGAAFARQVDALRARFPRYAATLARQMRREHRTPNWLKSHRTAHRSVRASDHGAR